MTPREVKELVGDVGLEVVSLVRNRHWKAVVRNRHGTEYSLTFPTSLGDNRRGLKNKVSQLRKIAEGV